MHIRGAAVSSAGFSLSWECKDEQTLSEEQSKNMATALQTDGTAAVCDVNITAKDVLHEQWHVNILTNYTGYPNELSDRKRITTKSPDALHVWHTLSVLAAYSCKPLLFEINELRKGLLHRCRLPHGFKLYRSYFTLARFVRHDHYSPMTLACDIISHICKWTHVPLGTLPRVPPVGKTPGPGAWEEHGSSCDILTTTFFNR